ncbi:P2Y purinoceptor 14-like protein [Labeo rohita]|uniref:Probable G-protein coupled receptor 34 n=1 Tax=Labeo rohita TaxID=84645 RepID=A0A498MMB6_LABRO|nr:P2Y purinoceptor 14-like protein [Labeo rohita]RXN39557.1 P2Y purinoceptor 14-like protein [Labeo rohita]
MKPNTTNMTQALCELPANEVFIFAYSLLFLVSLVLNCITMRVYFCTDQQVQSSVTVFMKNLVVADFFLCLCLPLRIAAYANNSEIMSNIYCSFGTTAFYINMYASIFFMDFIAANRYLMIVRPVETQALQTIRIAHYISAATWLCFLAMASIYLTLFLQNFWGQMPDAFTCESRHSSQLSVTYKVIHCVTFVGFVFVLVSLIVLYWKTHQKLRQVQISSQVSFRSQTFKRSKHNMLVLVVIFCVCFVPYHLVKLPYVFIKPLLRDCTAAQPFYILTELTIVLAALNASLDPLMYFFFCKTFRAQFNLTTRSRQPVCE